MARSAVQLDALLQRIDTVLASIRPGAVAPAVERYRADSRAASFHLLTPTDAAPKVAMFGRTGTGKSTLVNRLLKENVTAVSVRRTFTAGCVAIAPDAAAIPAGWLGVDHVLATALPAKGTPDELAIVVTALAPVVLVDTPDLDGDHPAHHAQADRAFRWATAIVFAVTPEKYQMTELLPYYRLAKRYDLPAAFVMNKCESAAVVEDYRQLLAGRDWPEAAIYVVPRDDAAFEPAAGQTLDDLGAWLITARRSETTHNPAVTDGNKARLADLAGRLRDQVIGPLRERRRAADAVAAMLRAMETPPPGVDVNPVTQQLQRRLQQRSVLYLIGPQRVLDRARQIPSLLARLPRAAWDYVVNGELPKPGSPGFDAESSGVPDFQQLLADAFAVVRSRIDDAVRSSSLAETAAGDTTYAAAFLPTDRAAAIATEELAELNQWLKARWNANPRDTRIIQKLLRVLPGGEKLSQWSEAAPYLLAVVVATHHAFFGPVDLLVLGGYSQAAWMTERLSNEVASRTRAANQSISHRFTALAHEQINRVATWLNEQAPDNKTLDALERAANELEEAIGV
jgi:hypothetical protein